MANLTADGGKIKLTPTLKEKAVLKDGIENDVNDSNASIEEQGDSSLRIIQQSSPILNLPAELRNRIWHLLLDDDLLDCDEYERPNYVHIDQFLQPEILRACLQTRLEGEPIFYNVNNFVLEITNLRGPPPLSHWLMSKVSRRNIRLVFMNLEYDDWKGVIDWLQGFHAGALMGLEAVECLRYRDWSRLFNMVELLQDVPWSVVKDVLQAHREAMQEANGETLRYFVQFAI